MKLRNENKRSMQTRDAQARDLLFVYQDSIFNIDPGLIDEDHEYFYAKIPTDVEEENNRILEMHLVERDFDFVDKSELPGLKQKENPYRTTKRSGTETHYTQKDHVLLKRAKDNPVRKKEYERLRKGLYAEDELMSKFESNPHGFELKRRGRRGVIDQWANHDE